MDRDEHQSLASLRQAQANLDKQGTGFFKSVWWIIGLVALAAFVSFWLAFGLGVGASLLVALLRRRFG